ncbi:MAG: HAMP domain-containing histidine kinase [Defluviitaleaceae bacterium]|nr:HAMP domain-containing histidine kinase [Defluviitaleaceae bacterium]
MVVDNATEEKQTPTEQRDLYVPLRPSKIFNVVLDGLRTLRFKLFLSYILISVVPLILLWSIISSSIQDEFLERDLAALRVGATQLSTTLAAVNFMHDAEVRYTHRETLMDESVRLSSRIFVADTMATIIFDSQDLVVGNTSANSNILDTIDGEHSYSHITDENGTMIESAVSILDGDNNVVGVVMLRRTTTEAMDIMGNINDRTIWLLVGIGIAVTVAVLIVASWLLRPLSRVLAAVKRISEGHLNQRVQLDGKDEISALGVAVNNMAQKLERVELTRQEFVSNVSHELKTPLSSIKVLSDSLLHKEGLPEATYQEFLWDISTEVDRMTDIINELLALVRLDEVELPLNIDTFPLTVMLEETVKRLRPLAVKKKVKIETYSPGEIYLEGDEIKLSLAVTNLIENAIKYSREDGVVKVTLEVDSKNAFITVADNGIGISEEDQEMVFSRFFRADKGRDRETGGTGLGLAITHKTILLHKGSIKLSSKVGEGSIFTARLPLHNK